MTLSEILKLIDAAILDAQLQVDTFTAIYNRGNRSKEYVEFKIAEAVEYEIASNYGCW